MKGTFKYIIIAALVGLIGFYYYSKYRVAPSMDFTKINLVSLDGKPFKLEDHKGRKLVVSFGASWCGNCWDELKDINSVKQPLLNDVEIVVISDEPLERVQGFKDRKNYPFTFVKMDKPFSDIGINAIPTTYIINTAFEIKEETVGYINWKDASTVEHLKKLME